MVKPFRLLAPVLALVATIAAAEEAPSLPTEWTSLAEETCVIAGRTLRTTVEEHVDAATATVVYKRESCLTGEDMPVTCVAVLSEPEPVAPGASSGGRAFIVRCSPIDRDAWTIGLRWTAAGIDVIAQRLDLRGLTTATVTRQGDALPEVTVDPALPLISDEPVTWSARDPQPGNACVPLGLAADVVQSGWTLLITPAATSCTGWKLRFDAATKFTNAEPLAGYAPPDLKAAAPAGPLKLELGRKPAAAADAPAHAEPKPAAAPKPASEPKPAADPHDERAHAATGGPLLSFGRR